MALAKSMPECVLCGTPMLFFQILSGIRMCNSCAADWRPMYRRRRRDDRKPARAGQ